MNDSLNSDIDLIPKKKSKTTKDKKSKKHKLSLLNVDTLTKAIEGFAEESAVEIHC